MAMQISWYGAERITQYGRSRATLDATGCFHWASINPILPPGGHHGHQFWRKNQVVPCEIAF